MSEQAESQEKPELDEEHGLPNLQSQRNSKVLTALGFAVISIFGVAMVIAQLNSGKEKIQEQEPEKPVEARMPRLNIPDNLPPPTIEPPVIEEKEIGPDDFMQRKMNGAVMLGGSSGSHRHERALPEKRELSDGEKFNELYMQKMLNDGKPQPTAEEKQAQRIHGGDTAKARLLKNRNFLLAKGSSLDCVLETALNSSVPGLATCRLTRDIYSDNGKVLLLDRGSQLVGEYSGGMRLGQKRMFLLWTRIKTPNGIVIDLDSPATDQLGRGGIGGFVDNHFWQRFGAAILVGIVSDGIQITEQEIGNTRFYMENSTNAGTEIVKEMLKQNANIPPTMIVNQGARVAVMVARDLDFSDVYKLGLR